MKRIVCAVVLFLSITTVFGQLSRELSKFEELEVTDRINVELISSDIDKIVIEGELANQLEVIQVDNELRLKMTGSYVMQGYKVSVKLYCSDLSKITAKKGATVAKDNGKLYGKTLNLVASEGGNLELDVDVISLVVLINTGGKVELTGKCVSQDINVMAGGAYFARTLKGTNAIVRVNAGGKVEVNTSKSIDAQTRAGGVIDIYGKPQDKKEKKFAGGKINYL